MRAEYAYNGERYKNVHKALPHRKLPMITQSLNISAKRIYKLPSVRFLFYIVYPLVSF